MNYKVNKFNIILTREFETLEEKEIKATVKSTYRNQSVDFAKFAKFANVQTSSVDNTISNEIIEYLIKKNNDFDFSIIKDEWRKEQYIELSKKLEKEGIYFEYLIQFNFKDKIKFFYLTIF